MEQNENFKVNIENVFEELDLDKSLVSAGSGKRFVNMIFDFIVMYILTGVLGSLIGFVLGDLLVGSSLLTIDEYMKVFFFIIAFAVGVVSFTLVEFLSKGRSLGKLVTKTKVVTLDGKVPTFKSFLIRTLCRYIPFEGFTFLISVDKGLHDVISKTKVVNLN